MTAAKSRMGIAKNYLAACVQNICVRYRVHPSSISHLFRRGVHEEAIYVLETVAGPEHRRELAGRMRIHQSWISVEELRRGRYRDGIIRMLTEGAPLDLALRPFVVALRSLCHRERTGPAKRLLHGVLREMGLLKLADAMMFVVNLVQFYGPNRRFVRSHADFAVPPAYLAFDAYNCVDWKSYFEMGTRHAQVYADVIRENMRHQPLAILEWGCGPGRLIRHMRQLLGDFEISSSGSDVNGHGIAWCRENLPSIAFLVNNFSPPIALPDHSFDVIYNFSVFTHLSEQVQKDWAHELWRLLKPGGLFICSTHGDYYKDRLGGKTDVRLFDSGRVVVKTNYEEGKKWYLALHPDAYVRGELLRDFDDVRKITLEPEALMRQDIWVARKTGARAP